MSPLLEVENLHRTFGRGPKSVHAVDSVSFGIDAGEIVTVVGESGSGKSTLARMVLRLLDPTAGRILLDGEDVTGWRGRAAKRYWRDVQAVFQDPFASFNQFFTVRRLLSRSWRLAKAGANGRGNGGPVGGASAAGAERRAMADALGEVGLDPGELLESWPHQLSGGQRQRVMIARALMLRPRILVADEPTSMLDASLRVTILNLLADLRRDHGMTILFITHDIGQACYLGDRVLVMNKGELVESGPTDEVIFDPQHPYTRQLLVDVPRLHTA